MVFKGYAPRPAPVSFRKLHSTDVDSFKRAIQNSKVLSDSLCFNNADELVTACNNELSPLVEKHAPKRTKLIKVRPTCPCYNKDLNGAKHVRRKLERKWRRTKLKVGHDIYRIQCSSVNKMLRQARLNYYSEKKSIVSS